MSWNYRVVSKTYPNGEIELHIHEAYYKSKRHKKPNSITENPVTVGTDSIKGMRWILKMMSEALKKTILKYEDF